ncbi:MAG TPA: TIGR02757 family protein [Candidatus Fermentibacter daniensis]|nr:MAG: hypothetical protein AO396_03505 [Candidatus Fermentibacter daniensis]MBP7719134.1 TIGR02757 family protein [Candidatus Fermentibacter sp.]OQC69242.1 MAG: hypothetical protein BWX47_01320 [candidate division Hyd24-12 bacterium ADurb.Bin004]KZD17349.1 MAG: hypothetical protein AO395_00475 [Candidatus Fermentibacter daniensis]KZD17988.1 MAG: hypothetical protein AO394_00395 [Candidatus Fermentibacter daniensis]
MPDPAASVPASLAKSLDGLYERFNRREFVEPDPLQFLYSYPDPADREIAALAASSLAYGRVEQIIRSVSRLLTALGPEPAAFLRECRSHREAAGACLFRHRFTPGEEMAAILFAAASVQRSGGGSLQETFRGARSSREAGILLIEAIHREAGLERSSMLPHPSLGSACKRLHLMFRWMVRSDGVDPGGWDALRPADLLVPLDVHMHRAGLLLGMTTRRQADARTVDEITEGFRRIRPDDPVRYDFALTRFGIRRELTREDLLRELSPSAAAPR